MRQRPRSRGAGGGDMDPGRGEEPRPPAGRAFTFAPGVPALAGRSSDMDIHLEDTFVSSKHALFEATPSGLQAEDLLSTNGTQVNGADISNRHCCRRAIASRWVTLSSESRCGGGTCGRLREPPRTGPADQRGLLPGPQGPLRRLRRHGRRARRGSGLPDGLRGHWSSSLPAPRARTNCARPSSTPTAPSLRAASPSPTCSAWALR